MRTKGVTMQDVAKAAGVSQSTVSMILNQKSSSFPTTTIEKVLAAATALNYQFRRTAPPPSNSTVLVIAVQTTNPYYSAMTRASTARPSPRAFRSSPHVPTTIPGA